MARISLTVNGKSRVVASDYAAPVLACLGRFNPAFRAFSHTLVIHPPQEFEVGVARADVCVDGGEQSKRQPEGR